MNTSSLLIRNAAALARTPARADALALLDAGLRAIRTPEAVRRAVVLEKEGVRIAGRLYRWGDFGRLLVVGVGKCALEAAWTLEEILGDRIDDGVVVDVRCGAGRLTRIRVCAGTHPFPSSDNVAYTKELLDLLTEAGAHDLVVAIISGGGSTLLCQPETHTCEEEELLVRELFRRGAAIGDLNIVRKHLSRARGGNMAACAYPAQVAALIFSDVPGDDLGTIASGPTVRDTTTKEDALRVLARFAPELVEKFKPHLLETPKDVKLFSRTRNSLIVSNRIALAAMREKALRRGYRAAIASCTLEGEAEAVARRITDSLHDTTAPAVLLYGGETTVMLHGKGKGGRNQHLALCALPHLYANELVLACASDGKDNGPFAGALADAITLRRAYAERLAPDVFRARCDSTSFFSQLEDALDTGYTGSNVADLIIAMKY